ncbi:MAG: hypothetical protein WC584_01000 [Candidatus Pacearchaeota archaeon]
MKDREVFTSQIQEKFKMNKIVFNEDDSALKVIIKILSRQKYRITAIISGVVLFLVLYYLFVSAITNNDLKISIDMDGKIYVGWSLFNAAVIAFLSGIILAMIIFKFESYRNLSGKGIFGFIGTGISAFGFGCPTCGAFLFGLFGMPLALMYFPFRGIELQIVGIVILLIFIYLTAKSIKGVCKIKILSK